jgi:hypothetical protein
MTGANALMDTEEKDDEEEDEAFINESSSPNRRIPKS